MHVHFITHASYEYPGYLLQWADENNFTTSFTKVYESPVYPTMDDFDLLIVMGGPMGVYQEEEFDWMKAEKAFIKDVIAAGKKVIGICFGSQLVAEALGANVYPNNQKEIGWLPVQKVHQPVNNAIVNALPDSFITFHWRGDTYDLPPGAVHLLQSEPTLHQAYLYQNRVLGLQFHMEAEPDLITAMVQHGKNELAPSPFVQQEEMIVSPTAHYTFNNRLLNKLLNCFLEIEAHTASAMH